MKKIFYIFLCLIMICGCSPTKKHTEVDGIWKSSAGHQITIKYPNVKGTNGSTGKITFQENGEYEIVFDAGDGFTRTYRLTKNSDKEIQMYSFDNSGVSVILKKYSD